MIMDVNGEVQLKQYKPNDEQWYPPPKYDEAPAQESSTSGRIVFEKKADVEIDLNSNPAFDGGIDIGFVPAVTYNKPVSRMSIHSMDSMATTVGVGGGGGGGGTSNNASTVGLTVTGLPPDVDASKERYCFGIFPPEKKFSRYLIIAVVCGFIYGIAWSVTSNDAVPGGNLFALIVIIAACWAFGELVGNFRLPALLGMLIMGFIIRNIPHLTIAQDVKPQWSSTLRNAALAIILTRAGMGLDPDKLKKMSWLCLRLACIPCVTEGVAAAAAAVWLLNFPWTWALTLGFVLAGLSPAVVVPPMLRLQEEGLGVDKGIPTLGVFTAGVDDALAVAIFGVFLSITFSNGALWFTIVQGPLEVIIGIAFGLVMGVVTWYIPNKNSKSVVFPRFALLFTGSLFAIFVSRQLSFSGAGAVGTLVFAFIAAIGWRKDKNRDKEVARIYAVVWLVMQPILFGLIGSEIAISNLSPEIVGDAIGIIALGLVGRTIFGVLSVLRSGFTWKEIIFIQFTCTPKATVQAAIGPLVLDAARNLHAGELAEQRGLQVLMIAAISILICAPLGAITIAFFAPRLLNRVAKEDLPQECDFEAE